MQGTEAMNKSFHNRSLVELAQKCGCYSCCNTFDTNSIKEWTDDNDTAICPICNIDSVIPDPADGELLAIKRYLFA
jgi:hypothetical protein